MIFCGRTIPFALIFLFYHGVVCVLSIFNYSFWMRFQGDDTVISDVRTTYLAFCIVGMVAYTFGAAPLFFYSYKYGSSSKVRAGRLRLGSILIYFTSSFPIFAMELYIAYINRRVVYVLDSIVLVLAFAAWSTGSLIVWFSHMWEVARFLQSQTGANRQVMFNPRFNPQGETAPPYLTAVANRARSGQPAVV